VQLSGSIGKHRRVVEVIEQTPEMIGVGVREDDLADGMPVKAGYFHVLGKLAGTGHVMRPGAYVDKDRLRRGAH
jgi:hypothetical protein